MIKHDNLNWFPVKRLNNKLFSKLFKIKCFRTLTFLEEDEENADESKENMIKSGNLEEIKTQVHF